VVGGIDWEQLHSYFAGDPKGSPLGSCSFGMQSAGLQILV